MEQENSENYPVSLTSKAALNFTLLYELPQDTTHQVSTQSGTSSPMQFSPPSSVFQEAC